MKTILATTCALLMTTQLASAQSFPGQPLQRAAGALSQGLNQTFQSTRGVTRQGFGTVQNATRNLGGSFGVGQRTYIQPYNGQFGRNQIVRQGYSTTQRSSTPQYRRSGSSAGVYQGSGYYQYGQSQPVYGSQPSYQSSGVVTSSYSQPQSSSSMAATSQVHMLRYDESGREFIIVNGQRIYFGGPNTTAQASTESQSDRYKAGYGSYDQEDQANSQSGNDGRNNDDASQPTANQNNEANNLEAESNREENASSRIDRASENVQEQSVDRLNNDSGRSTGDSGQSSGQADAESRIDVDTAAGSVDAAADIDTNL